LQYILEKSKVASKSRSICLVAFVIGLAQLGGSGCLQTAYRRPQVSSFTADAHSSRLFSVRRLHISGPPEDSSAGQVWRQITAAEDPASRCFSATSDRDDADAVLEVSATRPSGLSRTVSGTLWSHDGQKLWWGSAKQFVRGAANSGTLGIGPFLDELAKAVGCRSVLP
jgi:hypothetical protein